MRQQIMNGLRKAGDRVLELDAGYANTLSSLIMGKNPGLTRQILGGTVGIPIGDIGNLIEMSGELPSNIRRAAQIGNYALPAASTAARYGIPIAAGGALVNGIGGLMNQPVDQTNPPVGY